MSLGRLVPARQHARIYRCSLNYMHGHACNWGRSGDRDVGKQSLQLQGVDREHYATDGGRKQNACAQVRSILSCLGVGWSKKQFKLGEHGNIAAVSSPSVDRVDRSREPSNEKQKCVDLMISNRIIEPNHKSIDTLISYRSDRLVGTNRS